MLVEDPPKKGRATNDIRGNGEAGPLVTLEKVAL